MHLDVHPKIQQALRKNEPVVALESTIITHGMPWPKNIETALEVEETIRKNGALPATIAVLDGVIKIGLDADIIERLAKETDVLKLSRADLAFALSNGKPGSTTVAATMIAAELAGIEVFATGGIGGVHMGASESFDVSADLRELGRTNVMVVCAGPKAILDIPKTLEVLETNGVPVVGYNCAELPAFWSRSSGIPAPLRLNSCEEIAKMWKTRHDLHQHGSILINNPVPVEDEIPADEMNGYIAQAINEAKAEGISGKAVTPWLLSRIFEITEGKSLTTNIALIVNNAKLAAEIAVASCALMGGKHRSIGFTQ
ncbi:MAG: pseudouridine-5'-phosphate glycosidase [Rhizobiaceae bacterium]